MVTSRSPSARAAVTNSISLSVSTEPRTTRANCGTRKMALATMTLARPVPRAAMMASARKIPGKAIMMSTSRMISMSGQRPMYPAVTPSAGPTITPPLMAARLFTTLRRASLQKPGDRRRATGTSSAVADAGVEVSIGDVGEEIDQHEGGGDDEQRALHHGIVAREDALDDQPSHSGQREDRLGEHGAAQVVAELEAEDGENRDHGVAEGMPIDDEPIRDALGARRAHVILAQHLEHRGARGARDHGGRSRPQHEGRHHEVCGRA